jgi:hypothetical protein
MEQKKTPGKKRGSRSRTDQSGGDVNEDPRIREVVDPYDSPHTVRREHHGNDTGVATPQTEGFSLVNSRERSGERPPENRDEPLEYGPSEGGPFNRTPSRNSVDNVNKAESIDRYDGLLRRLIAITGIEGIDPHAGISNQLDEAQLLALIGNAMRPIKKEAPMHRIKQESVDIDLSVPDRNIEEATRRMNRGRQTSETESDYLRRQAAQRRFSEPPEQRAPSTPVRDIRTTRYVETGRTIVDQN